ncbi:hypothetical protein FE391_00020 [Nonomuraea sp. KC401]|uniref:hypothetical protein n=1 Tax=unclassified Nonomuraea TaxID=2593643 RepID=UPI0010FDA13E|nr:MULTISPECIES: hypothetical protein [unclassified Nonomuraea]NBE96571.1 hypothetical protein [Nonomuraea sp. K271]TLF86327.1 hypothetical protein FE391_00020 [Nonomuraea sp. KC401]
MRSKLATLFLATLTAGGCLLAGASPASATAYSGKSKWISSERGWQHAGVYVEPGDWVRVRYLAGRWSVDSGKFRYVSSAGYPRHIDRHIYAPCKVLKNQPQGSMIARINDDIYRIGRSRWIQARQAGFLQLRINDADACLGDNDGAVRVKLTVSDG